MIEVDPNQSRKTVTVRVRIRATEASVGGADGADRPRRIMTAPGSTARWRRPPGPAGPPGGTPARTGRTATDRRRPCARPWRAPGRVRRRRGAPAIRPLRPAAERGAVSYTHLTLP